MSKKKKPGQTDHAASRQAVGDREQGSLQAVEAERDDLLARLQRVSAEFINYKNRVQRQMQQDRQFANDDLIKSLLGVLDDMDRGLAAARENHPADDPLLAGMTMVHHKTMEVLTKLGLQPIEAVHQPFDPDQHVAIMQETDDNYPPQTVLKELQKGYKLNGRTIRPATVVVSRPSEPEQQRTGAPADEPGQDGIGQQGE